MIYRIRDWNKHYENNRTRELKRMEWVPVPNRMDGLGYNTLVDHPNGASHLGAWLAIVEIASRRDVRGTLPQEGAGRPEDALGRALGRMSRLPAGLFVEALPRLVDIGWIECFHEDGDMPQEGAGECLRARVTEGNGTEGNGTTSTTMPPLQTVSEYPLTIAAIRKRDAAVDDIFVLRLVQQTIQHCLSSATFPEAKLKLVTDKVIAKAVTESFATGPPGHRTGLLLNRVPNIVVSWSQE